MSQLIINGWYDDIWWHEIWAEYNTDSVFNICANETNEKVQCLQNTGMPWQEKRKLGWKECQLMMKSPQQLLDEVDIFQIM